MLNKILKSFLSKRSNRYQILDVIPKESVVAEIGVWKGQFSKEILSRTKPRQIYMIDPWKFYPKYENRWYGGNIARNQEDMDKIYNLTKKKYRNYSNVKILRDTSNNALIKLKAISLDFVYIDGNHSYSYVKNDLFNYFNKIKPGGIMAGDDLFWGIREGFPVLRAFINFYRKNHTRVKLISLKGNQFVFIKR